MYTAISQTVGDSIRTMRLERGLEQKDLAADGLPVQVIDLIEKNLCAPPSEWLSHFARLLGAPISNQAPEQSLRHAAQVLCAEGVKLADGGIYGEAGDVLMKSYDLAMAYQFYDLLPEIAPTLLQVLELSGRGEQAARVGMHAVTCMPRGIPGTARRDTMIRTGASMMGTNDFGRALDLFDEVLRESDTDEVTAVKMLLNSGTCYLNLGQFEHARTAYRQSLQVAEDLGQPFWLAWSCINLAAVDIEQHRAVPASLDYLDRAEKIAVELANTAIYAAAVHDRGAYYLYAGRMGRAQRLIEEAVEYIGADSPSAAFMLDDLAHVYIQRGFWRKAQEAIERMEKIAEEIGSIRVRALALRRRMHKSAILGQDAESHKFFMEAARAFLQANHQFDAQRTLALWETLHQGGQATNER